jgi:hypothetical protein
MVLLCARSSNVANEPTKSWHSEVSELLARAARLCADHGVEMDPFLRGATAAYFDARPGLREFLEDQQLQATLEELRKSGRMAEA